MTSSRRCVTGWIGILLAVVIPLGSARADVVINEIMYNPPQGDEHEYLELRNTGGSAVDISGWGFSEGVEHVFADGTTVAAGGFVLVVRSRDAFARAYPDVPPEAVVGEFGGRLDNGGETITLLTSEAQQVDSVRYDEAPPFDFLADGFGASLERVCATASGLEPDNWRAGAVPAELEDTFGGSPGRANGDDRCPPEPSVRPRVLISEILYHSVLEESLEEQHEWIEIHNASSEDVDLSGWRVAGGIDFTFPGGATIAAGEYLVVAKNTARLAEVPGYDIPAGALLGDYGRTLDNGGERVALIGASGQGVDVVEYDDDFPWPIAADGLGAGRRWLPDDLLPLEDHRHRGISLERISFDLPSGLVSNWAPSPLDGATPGRPNTNAATIPPTIVADIDAEPLEPEPGDDLIRRDQEVRITVVFSPVGFSGAAQLEYFVDDVASTAEPEIATVALADDGEAGDAVAGDRVFSAVLPPRPDNTIVRYRVQADVGNGLERVAPRPTDPNDWFAYFVSPRIDTDTKTYHLFVSPANWGRMWINIQGNRVSGCQKHPTWNSRVPAVFVHDGEVFDVQVRYQGSRWNRDNGRNISRWVGPRPTAGPLMALSWRIYLPRHQQLEGRGDLILNKLTQGCPGTNAGVGYALFRMAGLPGARSEYIRVQVNGNYYHYMLDLERAGDEMMRDYHREQHELDPESPREPVGHLFKSVGCNCNEGPYGWGDWRLLQPSCGHDALARYAATYDRKTHDWDDSTAFMQLILDLHEARRGGQDAVRLFFEDNFDMDLLMNYIAIINWSVPFDDMFQNHFIYQRVSDGKWFLFPWDLDRNFGEWQGANSSIYMGEAGDPSNRAGWWHYLKDAFLKAFRAEYEDRLLLLNNTILHPDIVAGLVDEFAATADVAEAARSPAGVACSYPGRVTTFKSFATTRHALVNSQIAGVRVDAGPDVVAFAGSTIQFDASGTRPEPGEDVVYTWSNGMEGVTPSATFDEAGIFTVTLTVTTRGVEFEDDVEVEIIGLPALVHQEIDGEVTLEAESFFENLRRDSEHTWWEPATDVIGFSGDSYMHAVEPDRRATFTTRYVGNAPELRYAIRFTNPGTYRLWMRAHAPSRSEDSFHVNFDSGERSSRFAQQFETHPTFFTWSGDTNREGPQLLEVTEPGIKLLSVWLKESNSAFDKIVLTQDLETPVTSFGPDESPLVAPNGNSPFVRGDGDGSGRLGVPDALATLLFLFRGATILECEDHGDFDDDGELEIADAVDTLRFLFLRGTPPPPPFPDPGFDTTDDAFPCGDS